MSDNSPHSNKHAPVRKRALGKARLAAASSACAALVIVVLVVMSGVFPFVGAPSGGILANLAASQPDAASQSEGATAKPAKPSEPARTPQGAIVPESMIPQVTVAHESEDVIVSFEDGYSAEELTAAIAASDCTLPREITNADREAGFVKLKVNANYDVEHAMTQLGMLPQLKGAQPNFIYQLESSELAAPDANGAAVPASEQGAALGGEPQAGASTGLHGGEGSAPNTPKGALAQGAAASTQNTLAAPGSGMADALTTNETAVDDPLVSSQWALESIKAFEAWDSAQANGNVTVAVLDNGCLVTHEDLKDNIAGQYDAIENDDVIESGTHGTHVAGIIAATANNGKGIAGVSYNAKVLPVQVLSASTSKGSTETVLTAFNYIFQNRPDVKVINMSFGGTVEGDSIDDITLDNVDMAFIEVVDKAYEKGILTVCSSGNDASKQGAYLNYPSDWLKNALSVIALKKGTNGGDPTRSATSNYNSTGQTTKDISAPGETIYSTWSTSDSAYRNSSGTSMAAPCVSGVAALVYAAKPDATTAQVADIICQTANKIQADNAAYDVNGFSLGYGYGEVDAEAAVLSAKDTFLTGEEKMLVGTTETLALANPDGLPVLGTWEWASSDNAVATVSDGTVKGLSGGTVIITAKRDAMTLAKTITVYDASFTGAKSLEYGASSSVGFASNPKGMWDLEVSNKNVVTLGSSKTDGGSSVRLLAAGCGTAMITARLVANPALQVSYQVTVKPADLNGATIGSVAAQTYTGSALKPKPTVTFNGTTLVEGVDYAFDYQNNTKVGTATLNVVGKGNYTGTASASFRIIEESSSSSSSKTPESSSSSSTKTPESSSSSSTKKSESSSSSSSSATKVPEPRFSGATKMPESSKATYTLRNCTMKVLSGSGIVSLSDATASSPANAGSASISKVTVSALSQGKAKLGIYDMSGKLVAKRKIYVYKLSGKTRYVKSALSKRYTMKAKGASKKAGANVFLCRVKADNAFRFRFTLQKDGTYKVQNRASKLFVGVKNGKKANGANIVQQKKSAKAYQRWFLTVDAMNRVTFTNKSTGKAIGVANGKAANTQNIAQYASTTARAQKWFLTT